MIILVKSHIGKVCGRRWRDCGRAEALRLKVVEDRVGKRESV